ncbi:hypothetical protein E2C01_023446 [Portunus trituberculatus]|uniref:Uncharacterized protein n=1 Tax=Portunus trituberculatus TaxID=210409 RepID=A0A5B7EAK2_PORTR|nr:hypothetical protein [Portunus trituberculatus]
MRVQQELCVEYGTFSPFYATITSQHAAVTPEYDVSTEYDGVFTQYASAFFISRNSAVPKFEPISAYYARHIS